MISAVNNFFYFYNHSKQRLLAFMLIALAALIFAAPAFNFADAAPAARMLPVLGEVKDLSGRPVAGARVALINEGGENGGSSDMTYTDDKGVFHFINKTEGIYSCAVHKEGYLSCQDTFHHTAAERRVIKISLTRSDSYEPEVIYLAKNTGNLNGSVICEATDEPVGDAVVSIGEKFVQTNEQGGFKLENIGVGPKIIKIQKNGYEKLEKEIVVTIKTQNMVVRLNKIVKYATIAGRIRIRGRSQSDCPPVKIYLAGKTAVADYKGSFRFENIGAGSYPIILIYNKKEVYNDIIKVENGITAYEILLERL
jgi:hypothetical protein